MVKELKEKSIAHNFTVSVSAQAVSLAVSFVLSLVVPKFIPETDYAYWQTYVLYAGYVGVLHFGSVDGMVLRYSKYNYEELDQPVLCGQFKLLLLWTSFIAVSASAFSMAMLGGAAKKLVVLVAVSIVSKNVFTYGSYMLQITNRIKEYAIATIAQRVTYGAAAIGMLALHQYDYSMFCIADICGDLIGIAVGMIYQKNLYFCRTKSTAAEVLKELKENIRTGALLLAANLSAVLLTGGAKMVIQWKYSTLTFSKISLAFSAANLFLLFVSALSIAFFPSLKRMQKEDQLGAYTRVSDALAVLLPAALLCYYPGCRLLKLWLPQYEESLFFWGLLLPMILFSSRAALLTDNYLKAFRKEKQLFAINLCAVVLAMTLYLFFGYVSNNLNALILSAVAAAAVRSGWSEFAALKATGMSYYRPVIGSIVLTVVFELSMMCGSGETGAAVYGCALTIYLLFNRKTVLRVVKAEKIDIE